MKLLFIIIVTFFTDTASIVFIGDIMQHRPQLSAAHIPGTDTLLSDSYDYSSYFMYTESMLKSADFAVANMEFTVNAVPFSGYPTFSAPSSLASQAQKSGIDLFLCANNHICDKGKRGLASTMDAYTDIRVPYTGIYRDKEDMDRNFPFITDICGIRVAFINFTYGTNGIPVPTPYRVAKMDTTIISEAISSARRQGAEFIIALPHWGIEYSLQEDNTQKKWRSFLLRNGVNAIIGSHPHVLQPITVDKDGETIKNITAYSLGNFISNMSKVDTQMGMIFTLDISKDRNGIVSICGYHADMTWCPRRNGPEKNYTTIPVKGFLSREGDFRSVNEHKKMKQSYSKLTQLFDYGK